MSFMDKLGSAAALAKWKADQQMRIVRAQSAIRELENQVKNQKEALGERAMQLYAQGSLAEADLATLCAAIDSLNGQLGHASEALRQVQAEQPPSDAPHVNPVPAPPAYVPPAPPAPVSAPAPVALVCPQCGMKLEGRFCPEHGVEGVPAA